LLYARDAQTQYAEGKTWAIVRRGALSGAGEWSHQYGDPGDTSNSHDHLVKGGLGVLWYGDPGPSQMVNRHEAANAPLKEKDVRLLARCTTLQGLGLYGKAVTSMLLAELTHLKLRWLRLGGTGIDDAAGPVLERFGKLTELRLPDTKVSDGIVKHLCRMTKLTTLDVSDTGITERGAERLARALPKCRVLRVD
jgi:hypothetical protein